MALIKCEECGESISSSAKVCPHCGVKINLQTCPECGAKLNSSSIIKIRILLPFFLPICH